MKRPLLALACVALLGCRVTDEAIATAQVAAAGNDRYTALVQEVLAGTAKDKNGPPVTPEDLKNTPGSVRVLLGRLLGTLHVNRYAWHSVLFQLNEGPDPELMGLKPVTIKLVTTDGH